MNNNIIISIYTRYNKGQEEEDEEVVKLKLIIIK